MKFLLLLTILTRALETNMVNHLYNHNRVAIARAAAPVP